MSSHIPPSLIRTVIDSPADRVLFVLPSGDAITAGRIRGMASHIAAILRRRDPAPFVLHPQSAALFVAGLLAGAACARQIVLPASIRADYLAEIGLSDPIVIADGDAATVPIPAWSDLADDPTLACDLVESGDIELILFTSGSTGQPERIAKCLSQLETEAVALDRLWGDSAGHIVATVSPLHIYGLLFRIFWPILSGRTSDDQAAAFWEELVGRLGPGTTLVASPAHLSRLPPIEFAASPPDAIFSSGQLLTAADALACHEAFGRPVTEVLGNTLTGGVGWRQQIVADQAWTPFAGVELQVDADQALAVRSPYIKGDALTPTGDRAELHADGSFALLGRADRMEKVNGQRVSLNRVEAALMAHALVARALAYTLPARRGDLAAMIILTEEGRQLLAADGQFALSRRLRRDCGNALEQHELPKHWRFEADTPKNSQGKEPLSALRALFDGAGLPIGDYEVTLVDPGHAEVRLHVDASWPWFSGHFPDQPVLPGIAQLHIAALLAKEIWGVWPNNVSLGRVKFHRIVQPGDEISLSLHRRDETGKLEMHWRRGDVSVSRGVIG